MGQTTARLGLPYPEPTDANNVPADLQALAERLAAVIDGVFTTAQRDALTGTDLYTGRTIYNTTTSRLEVYTGSEWTAVGVASHGDLTGRDAADQHPQSAITGLVAALAGKLNLSGGTMTGDLVLHSYRERDATSSTATMTVDLAGAQLQATSRSGALTVAWSNLPAAGQVRSVTLLVATSVTSITWPAGTRFPGGQAPPAPDGETWYSVVARGTTVTVLPVASKVA